MLKISDTFERKTTPETKRTTIQLTQGEANCYPLYYFIPTLTEAGKLVYHRSTGEQVQLHCLDLATGYSIQLTHGSTPSEKTHWKPWDLAAGGGCMTIVAC